MLRSLRLHLGTALNLRAVSAWSRMQQKPATIDATETPFGRVGVYTLTVPG